MLNDKNKTLLAERIIELVGNEELSIEDYNTILFKNMSDDDGMFIITESNVMSVINDPDAMNSLFKGGLNDLKYQYYIIVELRNKKYVTYLYTWLSEQNKS